LARAAAQALAIIGESLWLVLEHEPELFHEALPRLVALAAARGAAVTARAGVGLNLFAAPGQPLPDRHRRPESGRS
jgi:hypothetical protein